MVPTTYGDTRRPPAPRSDAQDAENVAPNRGTRNGGPDGWWRRRSLARAVYSGVSQFAAVYSLTLAPFAQPSRVTIAPVPSGGGLRRREHAGGRVIVPPPIEWKQGRVGRA